MTKAERIRKEAEEYRAFLNKVTEIAVAEYNEKNKAVTKSAKKLTDGLEKEDEKRANSEKITNLNSAQSYQLMQKKLVELKSIGITDLRGLQEKEFNDLKVSLAKNEIEQEQYYEKLAVLRDRYFSESSDEWTKYTLEIISYNKRVVEEQQKELEKQLKYIEDSVNKKYKQEFENIINKQNAVMSKADSVMGIYDKISANGEKNGGYTWIQLSDIDTEIEALKNYNKNMLEAKDRIYSIVDSFGLDENKAYNVKTGFFEQMANMGIREATQFSKYLTNIPEEKLSDYLIKWSEKNELVSAIPEKLFGDEAQRTAVRYADEMCTTFTQALEEKFGEIPDEFFNQGSDAANKFKEGFINAIDSVIVDISYEINERIQKLFPKTDIGSQSQVNNYSSYNIYGTSEPQKTVLEIYKEEAKKRMLAGDGI